MGILVRQVAEIREEQRLRTEISKITEIENKTSQSVRARYEENPYPCWFKAGLSPESRTIKEVMQEIKVNLDFSKQQFPIKPDILIAGCGTG